ncbi:hypothetical protein [Herbiconiux sp. UC225_62]|uniref:hypothetical protein n=1 Tax=Herbiconiux sp. UC225_62 TaxID=3350168 RepID=UPI0036D31E1E
MMVGLYGGAVEYNPGLLIFFGISFVVLGTLMVVFPRFFARMRARGWPGSRVATPADVRYARLQGGGVVLLGAICLVIALVKGLVG